MHLQYRNVNDAFYSLVVMFKNYEELNIVSKSSRNGPVLMIEEPVIVTYEKPLERVLFNQARDCNPFFHVFEALWMLAGRNDLAPLQYYVSTFDQFSDDGKTLNGAYGYRWRCSPVVEFPTDELWNASKVIHERNLKCVDQLQILIDHLKAKPDSRRAVLQMWNVEDDLLKVDTSKDVCCNLSVMFSIRQDDTLQPLQGARKARGATFLDMTVTNRSNDLIWGMLGANVVHFSFLQEYMAAHLGVQVGVYHQITNNLHVYKERFDPDKWLNFDPYYDAKTYENSKISRVPLVKFPIVFDEEIKLFINDPEAVYMEPFLKHVASPMCLAFRHHKERDYVKALEACSLIKADDWRIVATNWIQKRQKAFENKEFNS